MITSNYIKAFGFSVFHTYFENDVCRCLRFQSALPVRTLMKWGFQVREKINGFDLYYNGMQPLSSALNYIERITGVSYFEFRMDTTDELFTQFTEFPPDWLGQVQFNSAQYTVTDAQTAGDNAMVLTPTLASGTDGQGIGRVRFYFADLVASPAFEIRFSARATQWQYYIINRSATQLDNPSITGKAGISFEGPKEVTIASGQQALFFSTGENLLPLSLTPKYRFDLVNTTTVDGGSTTRKNNAKVVFKGLPDADPGNIGIVRINGNTQVSTPIYVYV